MCGSADADVCFSVIHNDNIYNSANPELKRVNLEPACRDLEPLGSSREKTHVGEAEALRVLSSMAQRGKGARTGSDLCLPEQEKETRWI